MEQGKKNNPDTATLLPSPKTLQIVEQPQDRFNIAALIDQIDPKQMMTGAAWKLDENGKAVPVNLGSATSEEGRSMIRQYLRKRMIESGVLTGADATFIDSEYIVSNEDLDRALNGLKDFMDEVKANTDPTKDMLERARDFCKDRKIEFVTLDSMTEIKKHSDEPFLLPLQDPYLKEGGIMSILKQRKDTNVPFKFIVEIPPKLDDEEK